ncbi:TraY domain-containing protein [Methylobacterium sp. W2]|uniref:TraY domain-containing protein n=1 Tax=Methylobacterium sp. W2 TaxID=2598107 RepID=UPI001D0CDC0C|nr:TraY domain-containing protein [Methylobacterium sp. W2]MCC0808063.1 TraY domain-containing protein [Methylobacterium sp. W2]
MAVKAAEREGRRATMSVRLSEEGRSRLERAASMNGRSLAQEVELRLERSFDQDDLYVALVGETSHARPLVQCIATTIRWIEGTTGKPFTSDWQTLVYVRRAVSRVCEFVLGTDYSEAEYLSQFAQTEDEQRIYREMTEQFAYNALRKHGWALPMAPGGKESDMSRRLPADPMDKDIE